MVFREQHKAVEALVPRFGEVMRALDIYYPDKGAYNHLIARYFKVMFSEAENCTQDYIESEYRNVQIELLHKLLERTAARYVLERERILCFEALAESAYTEFGKIAQAVREGHGGYEDDEHAALVYAVAEEFDEMRAAATKNVEVLNTECAAQMAGLVELGDTSMVPIRIVADARAYQPPVIGNQLSRHAVSERHYANALGICLADIEIAQTRMALAEVNAAYLHLAALAGYGKNGALATMLMNKCQITVNFNDGNGLYIDRASTAIAFLEKARDDMVSERYDRSTLYNPHRTSP